jgi:predicted GNAT family acetyltransferase
VAFCYAGATTESLWDVAIDTVEAHRRQGHAGRCAAFMIRRMRTFGKEPVWQSADDNPASWRLAAKLGFERVAELTWFRRDE